jgi:plasmid stabilization system protein ParE
VTRRVVLSIEAFAHVAEAFSWYQRERAGLGWEFDADLQRTFALLVERPEAAPEVHRGLRRALLQRFPYVVYYQSQADAVLVRAVLHTRRRPRRWRRAG